MTEQEIRERLQRLKRENKRLRLTIGTSAAILLAIVGISAAPQTEFYKTLETRRFELIDKNGDTSAIFTASEDGNTTLSMFPDAEGTCPVLVAASTSGVGMLMLGGIPKVGKGIAGDFGIALLNDTELGCGLHIADRENRDIVTMAVGKDSRPEVLLNDLKGNPRLAGYIDKDDSTTLALLSGGKGTGVAEMVVSPDSSSYLHLIKDTPAKNDTLCTGVEVYANDEAGGNGMRILDQKGNDRIQLSSPELEKASLKFRDAKGTDRMNIGYVYDACAMTFQGEDGDIDMYLFDSSDQRPGVSLCHGEGNPKIITDEKSTAKVSTNRKNK